MRAKIIKDNIDLNDVYFCIETGQNYDYINKDFYAFADTILLENTGYAIEKDKDIIQVYVNLLTNKIYFLSSENKIINNGNTNIINNYIEDMVSVSTLFKKYNDTNDYIYNNLINKFEGNNIISRKLFLENLDEIINLKQYVSERRKSDSKTSVKPKVRTI